jgi:hypothetical protein
MEAPQDFPSFLGWLRRTTETFWETIPEPSLADFEQRGVGGSAWMPNTRWHAFSDSDLAQFEAVHELSFPDDYRLFLTALGAPRPWMFSARFEGRTLVSGRGPSFTDWTDDLAVKQAMALPMEGLLFDVENGIWLDAWGPRPHSAPDRERVVRAIAAAASPLIPLIGHRFIAKSPGSPQGYLVLSIMQTDIVEYGRDLRDHLLTELSPMLGNQGRPFPEGSATIEAAKSVPFWGGFID